MDLSRTVIHYRSSERRVRIANKAREGKSYVIMNWRTVRWMNVWVNGEARSCDGKGEEGRVIAKVKSKGE